MLRAQPCLLALVTGEHRFFLGARCEDIYGEAGPDLFSENVTPAEGLRVIEVGDSASRPLVAARSGGEIGNHRPETRALRKSACEFVIGHIVARRMSEHQRGIDLPDELNNLPECGNIVNDLEVLEREAGVPCPDSRRSAFGLLSSDTHDLRRRQ